MKLETTLIQDVEAILLVRKLIFLIIVAGRADYITVTFSIPITGFLVLHCHRSTFSGSRKHLQLGDGDVGQLVP
jgi:phage gp46-like protein